MLLSRLTRLLPQVSHHSSWAGNVLAFYAFSAIGIAEGGLGVLLPSILRDFQLTPGTVTLLFLSQLTGYVVAALSSSLLSSKIGLARMLLLASSLLSSAFLIYAMTPAWSVMVATGTLVGLGIGLIDAGINTYIARRQENAGLMGLLHACYGLGALMGPAIAITLLMADLDWRQVYQVFASLVGVVVLLTAWLSAINYKPLTLAEPIGNAKSNLGLALSHPVVWVAGLLLMVYVGTEVAIGNWAYSVQTLSRDTPPQLAGYSLSAYWLGLTLGRLSLGKVMPRLGTKRLIDLSLGLLLIGLLSWWLLPQQLISLPVMGLALAAIYPTTIWLVPQRIPGPLVPAAIGFTTSMASLGAATIPTIVGWLADFAGLAIIPALIMPLAGLMVVLHRWLTHHAPLKPI